MEKMLDNIKKENSKNGIWFNFFRIFLPALMIISIILTALSVTSGWVIGIMSIIQLIVVFITFRKNNEILGPLTRINESISKYKNIFNILKEQEFNSELLKEFYQELNKEGGAYLSIKKLDNIASCFNIRGNSIIFLILNILFTWDLQCVSMFNTWKDKYGKNFESWLNIAGQIEALISLSTIALTKENVCLPEILHNEEPSISFKEIMHPHINESKCVANSLNLTNGSYIVTGSNMSGKTTFLRSVGINMVLLNAGAYVCASEFKATIMMIFSSMRIEDDVVNNISTFYAEINRIKDIMYSLEKKIKMLVLIDEIFKGTNSLDRIVGATKAIEKLSKKWCINMVTTHDFELCELEKDKNIHAKNYHFSEYYVDDKIKFDYLIKEGKCTTKNAQVLMKLAGII
jgi:DNA mismatch repair ATPase MutS